MVASPVIRSQVPDVSGQAQVQEQEHPQHDDDHGNIDLEP
jgi:hypothetical protein